MWFALDIGDTGVLLMNGFFALAESTADAGGKEAIRRSDKASALETRSILMR